jgi:hypothetical protein
MDPHRVDRLSHDERHHEQDLAEAEITLEGLTDNFEGWHDLTLHNQLAYINDAIGPTSRSWKARARLYGALSSKYATADPGEPVDPYK